MLDISWMYSDIGAGYNGGFRDLIEVLANAPWESVFSTELVIVLV